jgi:fatty acid-binding protein DegV
LIARKEWGMTAYKPEKVSDEVVKEALEGISKASESAAKVDAEELKASAATSEALMEAFKEAIKNADSPEERMRYAKMAENGDKRQKKEARDCGERSTTTQRGNMRIGAMIATGLGAAALTAGAVFLHGKLK